MNKSMGYGLLGLFDGGNVFGRIDKRPHLLFGSENAVTDNIMQRMLNQRIRFADKYTHIAAVCCHFQHFGGKSGAVQLVVHQRMAGDVFVQRLAAAVEIRVQRVEEYNKKRHLAQIIVCIVHKRFGRNIYIDIISQLTPILDSNQVV
nr:MAG TPA: hypothetical protein [Caudoviricetes sp.]